MLPKQNLGTRIHSKALHDTLVYVIDGLNRHVKRIHHMTNTPEGLQLEVEYTDKYVENPLSCGKRFSRVILK